MPVIFLSVYGQDETVDRAFDMVAADYMVKPFSPTELAYRIRAGLRQRREPLAGEQSAFCRVALCVNKPRKKSPVGVDRAS